MELIRIFDRKKFKKLILIKQNRKKFVLIHYFLSYLLYNCISNNLKYK